MLLSHDHFDHLCSTTMKALAKMSVPIVTALGVGAHLETMGVVADRITELDWEESVELEGLRFTASALWKAKKRTATYPLNARLD